MTKVIVTNCAMTDLKQGEEMKICVIAASLLLASTSLAQAAEPVTAAPDSTYTKVFAGFTYAGDMDMGELLHIYPSKETVRRTPLLTQNNGVISIRMGPNIPKLLGLKAPEADGNPTNSCKGYAGIGVFTLKDVKVFTEPDSEDAEGYTVLKGTLATATDLRVMHFDCEGAAAEQEKLYE